MSDSWSGTYILYLFYISFKVNKTDIEHNRVNKILTNNKICVQSLQSSL